MWLAIHISSFMYFATSLLLVINFTAHLIVFFFHFLDCSRVSFMQEQHLPWVHEFRKWFIPSYRTALAGCDDDLRVSSFLRESCSSNFPPEHCMWHISWSANMLVEPKSRHRSHIQQVCKNVPPPFLRTTPKSVRWQHPIKYINAFHSLVVHVNKMWLVNWILIPFLYTSFYFVNWIHTTVVAGNYHSWVVIPLHSQYCTIWSVIEIASLSLFSTSFLDGRGHLPVMVSRTVPQARNPFAVNSSSSACLMKKLLKNRTCWSTFSSGCSIDVTTFDPRLRVFESPSFPQCVEKIIWISIYPT